MCENQMSDQLTLLRDAFCDVNAAYTGLRVVHSSTSTQLTHEFLRQGIHKLAELGSMRSPVPKNAEHMQHDQMIFLGTQRKLDLPQSAHRTRCTGV